MKKAPGHHPVGPPMTGPTELVCGGRQVDYRLRPVGEPCGRTIVGNPWRSADVIARHQGWSVIPLPDGSLAVTCDRCRRPDPAIAALAATLPRGTRR